jgi:hypothetical protein
MTITLTLNDREAVAIREALATLQATYKPWQIEQRAELASLRHKVIEAQDVAYRASGKPVQA